MKKYFILCLFFTSCNNDNNDNLDTILGYSIIGSCDLYKEIPLVIDPDFSNEEINNIRIAAKYWEDTVGIDFGGLPISNINCARDNGIPGCITRLDECLPNDIYNYSEIFIYADHIHKRNYPFNLVVAHEIGHYIGMPHVNDKKSIMWPTTYSGQVEDYEISDIDIEIYEDICIFGHLN